MNHLSASSLVGVTMVALIAFVYGGTASATTLEVQGAAQNKSVSISASLAPGSSTTLRQTDASFVDTCTGSGLSATTWTYTGTEVSAPPGSLTLTGCTHGTKVDSAGSMSFRHLSGTNGSVYLADAEITVQSTTFGMWCAADTLLLGTRIGTLSGTGSSWGHAKIKVNAVLNGSGFCPEMVWEGEYIVTSPTGLGVVA